MKFLKEEKQLVRLIQVGPAIFSIIILLTLITFILWNKEQQLKREIETVTEVYYEDHKHELYNKVNIIHEQLQEFVHNEENELNKESLNRVYDAYNTAENIYNKYQNTKSKEEILQIIIEALRGIRFFDQKGYFLIFGLDGKIYLNDAFPQTEGSNIKQYSKQFEALEKILQTKKETYYSWDWYKPEDPHTLYKKRGFFKRFEPYNIMFGTGHYLEDFVKSNQEKYLTELSKIRYSSKDEYIFVVDYTGTMLTHFDPHFIGTNALNWKDQNGFKFMKAMIDLGKKKSEGFVKYDGVVRPSTGYKTEKTSYIKVFEPWQWVIGSGFYNEALEELISAKKTEIEKKSLENIQTVFLFLILTTIGVLILSSMVARILKEKFQRFKRSLAHELLKNERQNEILQETLTEKIELENVIFNSNMVSITDIEGNILYANDAFCKITGYSKEELIGHNHSIMKSPQTKKSAHQALWNTILNGDIWRGISHNVTKEGKDIYLNTTISPLRNKNGEIVKFIATRFDMTEKVKADLELRKKENILVQQSKMAAMGEMLGAIAHQWRQPLSVISIASTGVKMQKELNVLSDQFLYESMDSINDSVQYLSRTIDDFRHFYNPNKLESNFDIQDALDKTFNLVKVQFENNCIQVVKDIQSVKLFGLHNELLQVIINILNNAKDQLVLTQSRDKYVFVTAKKENENLIITICDSAGGIKNEHLLKIFDPYFTTKDEHHGTGIGLYMSQEIIEKNMGGKLEAYNQTTEHESRSYFGACFKITLPIK